MLIVTLIVELWVSLLVQSLSLQTEIWGENLSHPVYTSLQWCITETFLGKSYWYLYVCQLYNTYRHQEWTGQGCTEKTSRNSIHLMVHQVMVGPSSTSILTGVERATWITVCMTANIILRGSKNLVARLTTYLLMGSNLCIIWDITPTSKTRQSFTIHLTPRTRTSSWNSFQSRDCAS